MTYTVSREGTTLITLHEGTDTTACRAAAAELEARFADQGAIAEWTVVGADVFEGPAAPFDPYTIAVNFAVSVAVDADDEGAAKTQGTAAIESALADTDLESITYTNAASAKATGSPT